LLPEPPVAHPEQLAQRRFHRWVERSWLPPLQHILPLKVAVGHGGLNRTRYESDLKVSIGLKLLEFVNKISGITAKMSAMSQPS
jgi:hypothetical protein